MNTHLQHGSELLDKAAYDSVIYECSIKNSTVLTAKHWIQLWSAHNIEEIQVKKWIVFPHADSRKIMLLDTREIMIFCIKFSMGSGFFHAAQARSATTTCWAISHGLQCIL